MDNPGAPDPRDPEDVRQQADNAGGFGVHVPVEGELDEDDGYVNPDGTPNTKKEHPVEGSLPDEA